MERCNRGGGETDLLSPGGVLTVGGEMVAAKLVSPGGVLTVGGKVFTAKLLPPRDVLTGMQNSSGFCMLPPHLPLPILEKLQKVLLAVP